MASGPLNENMTFSSTIPFGGPRKELIYRSQIVAPPNQGLSIKISVSSVTSRRRNAASPERIAVKYCCTPVVHRYSALLVKPFKTGRRTPGA